MVQTDCTSWLGQVLDTIPTVVFSAKHGDENVFDVSVTVDGKPGVTQLDGRPIEIDPGLHTFVFERAGSPPIEKRAIVAARDKAQEISVIWKAAAEAAPAAALHNEGSAEKERPIPPLFYVLTGTTVAGFGTFAALGVIGENNKSNLESSCAPHCTNSQVSSLKTEFLIADIAAGIGGASAAGALIVFLARPERDKPAPAGIRSFGVAPVAAGAALQLGGVF
jgi:hypothetical protein